MGNGEAVSLGNYPECPDSCGAASGSGGELDEVLLAPTLCGFFAGSLVGEDGVEDGPDGLGGSFEQEQDDLEEKAGRSVWVNFHRSAWMRMRFSSEMGSLTRKRRNKRWPNEDDSPAYSWTILRPGMSRKWRRLTVKTGKPSSSAVAPTSRSPKGIVTPWACCSPSIFPASKAVAFVYG